MSMDLRRKLTFDRLFFMLYHFGIISKEEYNTTYNVFYSDSSEIYSLYLKMIKA